MVEAEPQLRLDQDDVCDGGPRWATATGCGSAISSTFGSNRARTTRASRRTHEPDPEDNNIRYFNRDYEETLAMADRTAINAFMRLELEQPPETKTVLPRDKRLAISSRLE